MKASFLWLIALTLRQTTPGADAAAIPAPPSPPILTNFTRLPNRAYRIRSVGEAGRMYSVQASPNFTDWVTLISTNAADGIVEFIDAPGDQDRRFYRSKVIAPNETTDTNYHGWPNAILLSNGRVEAIVVPAIGRIMQFRFVGENGPFWEDRSLDGQNPDPNSTVWKNFGGDKTWPAPQADWPKFAGRGWPPPKAFDSMSVTSSVAAGVVTLTSPVDPGYGIRTLRRIELRPEEPVMTVTTAYEKISGVANNVGVWAITQLKDPLRAFVPVPPSSRFPKGYTLLSAAPPPGLIVTNGLVSLTRGKTDGHKIGSDAGTLLWVGESMCLRIDSSRTDGGEYPDNGSSAEVYTNPDPQPYVELEMLGPLQSLQPSDRIERTSIYTLIRRTEATPEAEARRILAQ